MKSHAWYLSILSFLLYLKYVFKFVHNAWIVFIVIYFIYSFWFLKYIVQTTPRSIWLVVKRKYIVNMYVCSIFSWRVWDTHDWDWDLVSRSEKSAHLPELVSSVGAQWYHHCYKQCPHCGGIDTRPQGSAGSQINESEANHRSSKVVGIYDTSRYFDYIEMLFIALNPVYALDWVLQKLVWRP